MSNAVFLDRDNTLIANDGDLGEPDRVRLMKGVPAGLKMLREAGYRLIVVTNQGGVARGAFTEDDVDAVHQRIAALVDEAAGGESLVSRFYYCPYHPEATIEAYRRDHPWRKPRPGMLLQAARDMKLDLARSWLIGDAERDVQAGRAAGCRTVLVSTEPATVEHARPTASVATFAEAVETILREGARLENGASGGTPDPVLAAPVQTTAPPTPAQPSRAGTGGSRADGEQAGGPDTDDQLTDPKRTDPKHTDPRHTDPRHTDPRRTELKRAINELTEEIRTERVRRSEFTALRLGAGMCLLLALLFALLGILQVGTDVFYKWTIGAALALLLSIAILLLDLKG